MNNTNDSNGRGIFLAVVGIATLIITAVGATFAYFVASASGNTGKAAANSASFANTLKIQESYDARSQLIPVTDANMATSYSTKDCKGYSAAGGATQYDLCSTYTFKIINNAAVAQTVHIDFKTNTKTFTNLYYILYDGADNAGSAVTTAKATPAVNGTDKDIASATIAAGGNTTFTVVLWIHETSGDQTAADSGKTFTGTVSITTDTGTSHITGVINQVS